MPFLSPKFAYSLYLPISKYTQLRTRQNKTLSDNLHSAACKQSHSHVKIQNARSVDAERLECAFRVIGAIVFERARCCFESVNERISDSSECPDTSELLYERTLYNFLMIKFLSLRTDVRSGS